MWILRESLIQRSRPHLRKQLYSDTGSRCSFPTLDRLPSKPTRFHPVQTVHADESTLEGNHEILEDIFIRQFGFDKEEDRLLFEKKLRLIYGDQKTFARLWTIRKDGVEEEEAGYGQYRWLLPVPALFHYKMCYLKVVYQQHYEPVKGKRTDQETTHSYLKLGAGEWGRKRIKDPSKDFYAVEEFLTHSFDSRVLVAYWSCLLNKEPEAIARMSDESFEAACNKAEDELTVSKFEGILKDLYTRLLVSEPEETDPELRNHYYFTQMFEPYLLLKAAIKYGDVGYISRALDKMSIYIFGSASTNYAIVSMFLAYLTRSKGSDPAVARAWLANAIVNETGKTDGWKEIDLLIEHLNHSIKEAFRNRANSSFDFVHAMDYTSLNAIQFKKIRKLIYTFFGVYNSGKHRTMDADKDITRYANVLRTTGSFHRKPLSQRMHVFAKENLFQRGFDGLADRVKRFNDNLPGSILGGDDGIDDPDPDELEGTMVDQFFGDIRHDDPADDMMEGLLPLN